MKVYVVITGASSGIGQALAVSFANEGYHVLAIGRNQVGLERTKRLAVKGSIIPLIADLSEKDAIDIISKQFNSNMTIKYLIHCAGTLEPLSPLLKATRSDLKDNIVTNVIAPIALTSKLKPYFNLGTRVLFMGSDFVGVENKMKPKVSGAYAMSKTALKVGVEYLRRECDGIAHIGYLNPGSTHTPMYASFFNATNPEQGTTNNGVKIADPVSIANFIKQVLENSGDKVFNATDWDYRNVAHHDKTAVNAYMSARL